MSFEYLAPVSQALATFAGAVFVLVGIWYRERLESGSRSRNTRVQIAAEMRALLDLIELNGYLAATREFVERLRGGQLCYLNFSSNRSFVSVYEANLQNLGHLGRSAPEVVRFYMVLLSALEDKDSIVETGRRITGGLSAGREVPDQDRRELLRRHEFFLAKLSEAVRIGERVCAELNGPRPSFVRSPARQPAPVADDLDSVVTPGALS